jgi:polyhydroxyalkanoate synthase
MHLLPNGALMTKTTDKDPHAAGLTDLDQLSRNMAQFVEEAGKVTAAYLRPIEERGAKPGTADEMSDVVKTLAQLAETWMANPQRAIEAQSRLASGYLALWSTSLKRLGGENAEPVASADPRDKRFSDPAWQENPAFDFVKQAYLITSTWAEQLVEGADGLDEHTRDKARFYVKQIASALSPSNFVATNPELLRETLRENGANLVRGMKMLAEDIKAGGGELKIRQSDPKSFTLGVNMAITPGKVIFRNEMMELIQYAPTTATVLRRPVLIVPPWINKYYILDLNPDKSLIRWMVGQGLTVFCISWVNPDERYADKSFEHYMREGLFAALDVIEQTTGEKKTSVIGYCIGGTLLAMALAYMAAKGIERVSTATLMTAQVDFSRAGDLKVFIDEEQIAALEEQMKARGYLDAMHMNTTFNMLRPNDLIWPYVVNVYLKGQTPYPFDLLHWNSDSTRMAAATHSFYLRRCYLNNELARGLMAIDGVKLDLKRVTIPIYDLATREDHIAPARSIFAGAQLFGGPVRLVITGSGHVAGVINPPHRNKYQFWTSDGQVAEDLETWLAIAKETSGSWWPDWFRWLEELEPDRVPARDPERGKFTPLCDAPGTYVTVSA